MLGFNVLDEMMLIVYRVEGTWSATFSPNVLGDMMLIVYCVEGTWSATFSDHHGFKI